jgi:hypothetical protein
MTAPFIRLPRLIVCAAIQRKDGAIITGARHFDALMHAQIMREWKPKSWREAKQGFIDQRGKFISRNAAWRIARAADQLRGVPEEKRGILTAPLFSEDLY